MCAWTVLRAGDAVGVLLSYHSHRDHGLHPLLLDQSRESGLIFFFPQICLLWNWTIERDPF